MKKEPVPLRFSLEGALPAPVYTDPRVESLRRQLAALLDLVVLTKNGEPVDVDGFKLVAQLREPDADVYRIFADTGLGLLATEGTEHTEDGKGKT